MGKTTISIINVYFAINQLHCLTLSVRAEVLAKKPKGAKAHLSLILSRKRDHQ